MIGVPTGQEADAMDGIWSQSRFESLFEDSCPHRRTGYGVPRGPRILSISKRTDIPAFYLPWLLERLEVGWVDVPNPMWSGRLRALVERFAPEASPRQRGRVQRRRGLDQALTECPWGSGRDSEAGEAIDRVVARATTHVSLRREHVLGVVWWSKNYAVYLRSVERIDRFWKGIPQHFHFTINPRRSDLAWLEPDVPPLDEAKRQLAALAQRGGAERVTWRYDPLVFWWEDGVPRSSWDPPFFEDMAAFCQAIGVRRCVTSIADHYRKFRWRMRRFYPERALREPDAEERRRLAREMSEIARRYGIVLEACAESSLVQAEAVGFRPAACIDARGLAQVTEPRAASDRAFENRAACGCHAHVDIGDYDWQECGYGCVYCYANPNHRYYPTDASGGCQQGIVITAHESPGFAQEKP
ncbi:MAG: DUF1848 family protein [Thermomicrobium sp.]|nr:DUF1848 family protein [Thermomicrobium sp.]